MIRRTIPAVIAATLTTLAQGSWAGPWLESGDAGWLPASAQQPTGSGELTSISGHYGVTDVDMYRIYIGATGPVSSFSASGLGDGGLYLFNEQGKGVYAVLANGSAAISNVSAYYPDFTPGIYYLAVASHGMEPYGLPDTYGFTYSIFPTVAGFGPFGPTGPGHNDPVTSWGGGAYPNEGNYTIQLNNASFVEQFNVPEPATIGFAIFAAGLIASRRQHLARRPA